MKLADLRPEWWAPPGRTGIAIIYDCPCCVASRSGNPVRLVNSLNPPLDGGAPVVLDGIALIRAVQAKHLVEGEYVGCCVAWARKGETFQALTLSPSVDASRSGHWHGWIRNGEVTNA